MSEPGSFSYGNHPIESIVFVAGVLRGEKVELAAAVKKQQVRVHHLEETLEAATKEVS